MSKLTKKQEETVKLVTGKTLVKGYEIPLEYVDDNGCDVEIDSEAGVLEIFTEPSSGEWYTRCTFNSNGDKLTKEDSTGYSEKYTYDKNGNKSTYEDTYGMCEQWTYDNDGNLLSTSEEGTNLVPQLFTYEEIMEFTKEDEMRDVYKAEVSKEIFDTIEDCAILSKENRCLIELENLYDGYDGYDKLLMALIDEAQGEDASYMLISVKS